MATTTTNFGWAIPTSTDLVKDGATAIATLGQAIDTTANTTFRGGLTLISSTTIGSAVSSVSVNDCFSATYTNYRIIFKPNAFSTSDVVCMRYRVSGADNSSGSYRYGGTNFGGTWDYYSDAAYGNTFNVVHRYARPDGIHLVMDIINPFATNYTTQMSQSNQVNYNPPGINVTGGSFLATTSFTGFTMFPQGGTMTGGTIKVYGYKE